MSGESTDVPAASDTKERDEAIVTEMNSKIANLVRIANTLPKLGDEFEFCNSFPAFSAFMQQQEVRLQSLMQRCMETAGCPVKAPKVGSGIDDYMNKIITANDSILERTGICMDAIEKAHRDEQVLVPKTIIGAESTKAASIRQPYIPYSSLSTPIPGNLPALLKAARENKEAMRTATIVIARPQKDFNIVVDNTRNGFISKLRIKHNSREIPRGLTIIDLDNPEENNSTNIEDSEVTHPYRVELDHFKIPERQLESADILEPPKSLEKTTLTVVNTKEGLERLLSILNNEKEFAIDLEHNNQRSFLGITCLIQISTRTTDYIVDPFPIWDELPVLNEPFTNPDILKVFHGGDSDIQWLQRDFGIHVVNMFDTYLAMKLLEMPKFSLLYLVKNYCDVTLNKQLQLSDWRTRPLSQEQLEYARCDTHYLLYCYDRCREDLIQKGNEFKNLLKSVYDKSAVICGKPYEKPIFDPLGYEYFLTAKRTFNSQQVFALKELWRWRDSVARTEDESVNHVLPTNMMLNICDALPREAQGIAACCNPVPEMVKKHILELHKIIYSARDQPLILGFVQKKNIMGEEGSFLQAIIDEQNRMTKVKSILRCNLDFSHSPYDEEIGKAAVKDDPKMVPRKANKDAYFLLDEKGDSTVFLPQLKKSDEKLLKQIISELEEWSTPYERYSIGVKKAAEQEAQRKEEEEKKKKEMGVVEKKLYSHHDPINPRPKDAQLINVNVDNIELSEKRIDDNSFPEDETLTKKGLARKRKQARKAADIKFDGNHAQVKIETEETEEGEVEDEDEDEPVEYAVEEKPGPSKKIRREAVEPVDYSQYDPNMFYQEPKKAEFDPFHQQIRKERKSGRGKRGRGRRGGGLNRGGSRSTSFMPNQGRT